MLTIDVVLGAIVSLIHILEMVIEAQAPAVRAENVARLDHGLETIRSLFEHLKHPAPPDPTPAQTP